MLLLGDLLSDTAIRSTDLIKKRLASDQTACWTILLTQPQINGVRLYLIAGLYYQLIFESNKYPDNRFQNHFDELGKGAHFEI